MTRSQRVRVVAALIEREGEILIAQRPFQGVFPGKWEFPGGKVRPDERDEAALARELEEELNVRPRIGARVAEIDHDYSHLSVKILFYRCFLDGRELLHPREHAELRWVRPSELTSFDFLEADLDLVEQLKDGKL